MSSGNTHAKKGSKRAPSSSSMNRTGTSKKNRSSVKATMSLEEPEALDFALLEKQILESRKHYNNVAVLLQHARNVNLEGAAKAQLALCRVFCRLFSSGSLDTTKASSQNERVVVKWLRDRLTEYWALLLDIWCTSSLSGQKQCLRLLMQLIKEEADARTAESVDADERFATYLEPFLDSESGNELQSFFIEAFAGRYKDILSLTFRSLSLRIKEGQEKQAPSSLILFMKDLVDLEPEEIWCSSLVHKKDISKDQAEAWLALLGTDVAKSQRKLLLELIPTKIAPCMQRPERLLDFLTDAFDAGGSTSLLALSGIFELIKSRNLDYPQFYRKVYSLLDPFIMHSKHRSRFLRLLESFLSSTHLPAILIASFIKRLSRLCLFAPPSAIAVIVPLVYNLLKAHPSCTFMIHRESCCNAHEVQMDEDPFRMDEEDPTETSALDSSLWELRTLQSHYNPNVAVICRIISEQFTKPAFNLEDFLDHSYASMLDADLAKPMKKEPVVEYMIPKTVFPSKNDQTDGVIDDALGVWSFAR